jgi:hypothetical protein
MRELHQESAQILKAPSQDSIPLGAAHFRESNLKIPHSGATLAASQMKAEPCEAASHNVRQTARHDSEKFDEKKSERVLGGVFNASMHRGIFTHCTFQKERTVIDVIDRAGRKRVSGSETANASIGLFVYRVDSGSRSANFIQTVR